MEFPSLGNGFAEDDDDNDEDGEEEDDLRQPLPDRVRRETEEVDEVEEVEDVDEVEEVDEVDEEGPDKEEDARCGGEGQAEGLAFVWTEEGCALVVDDESTTGDDCLLSSRTRPSAPPSLTFPLTNDPSFAFASSEEDNDPCDRSRSRSSSTSVSKATRADVLVFDSPPPTEGLSLVPGTGLGAFTPCTSTEDLSTGRTSLVPSAEMPSPPTLAAVI